MITASVTHINTRQDMSSFARAHENTPGINWSVQPGPGGTMIIVEHEAGRPVLAEASVTAAGTGVAA
jgi:hypothetical protein